VDVAVTIVPSGAITFANPSAVATKFLRFLLLKMLIKKEQRQLYPTIMEILVLSILILTQINLLKVEWEV
jgi:hypothetical protein